MFSSENWFGAEAGFYNGVATTSYRNIPSATLTFTQGTPTSATTFCMGGWFKRQNNAFYSNMFSAELGGSGVSAGIFAVSDDDTMIFYDKQSSDTFRLITDREFRDTSAWYHVWLRVELGNSTSGDRVQLWVNGVRETSFSTETYPTASVCKGWNVSGKTLYMGHSNASYGGNIYYSDWYFIDGASVSPVDTVGEFKNGIFIPKAYSPTFGDNGFHLKFDQVGVGSPSSSTIGADTSGNTNHFTSTANTNVVASDCAMPDSPENNFATLNALNASSNVTVSNGNLNTVTSSGIEAVVATLGVSTGKWYWEVHINATSTTSFIGITTPRHNNNGASFYDSNQLLFADVNGSVYYSSLTSRSLPAFEINDIVKIKLDLDNQTMEYSINDGSYVGSITLTDFDSHVAGETWLPTTKAGASGGVGSFNHTYNFGQDSSFAGNKTSGSAEAQDGNGIGDFYYAPPSGYLALCTSNLPEPTISPNALTQADDYFNTVLYTGNATDDTAIAVDFQPDWTWIKKRSGAQEHVLFDSSRGATKRLFSNLTNVESDEATSLKAFTSSGFTLGTHSSVNDNTETFVAWNWKANGGTTVTNEDGSIDSTVQANTTSGLSIVTYTGDNGSSATIGHGLGTVPAMIIVKVRNTTNHWAVYHQSLGNTKSAYLSLTQAPDTNASFWNNTSPTSSVFTIGTDNIVNASNTYVAYCFAEVEGYSKFGSYTGSSGTVGNGTFVYLGFKPSFVMLKDIGGGEWGIFDSARNTSNVVNKRIGAESSGAEYDGDTNRDMDFLSNGFKLMNAYPNGLIFDNSARSYIYMAFAENPFKYANAR